MRNHAIQPAVVLSTLLLFAGSDRALLGAELTAKSIQQQVNAVLVTDGSSLPDNVGSRRLILQELLMLEVDRIHWREGQLEWPVRRRRKMTPDERGDALQALDGLLRYALGELPTPQSERFLSREEAQHIVDRSRLWIAPQPYIWEVTNEQFDRAMDRALRDRDQLAKLQRMQSEFKVPSSDDRSFGPPITFENGIVTWPLLSSREPNQRIFGG